MKTFLLSIITLFSIVSAFSQSTPISVGESSKYVNELGLVFPTKSGPIRDYINANNIRINPLTSGFSSGFQIGRHRIINEKSTLGVVLGSNAFYSSDTATTQIYQTGLYLTGRLYFGETWRNGVFAEVTAGPEFAATSIQGSDFQIQTNVGTRIGVGYNYQFNRDVTLGVSLVASPSILSDNYLDGSRVVINMLW